MLGAAGQARLLGEPRQQCCQIQSQGSRFGPIICGTPWPHSTVAAAHTSPLHSQQQQQQQQQVCWHHQQQHYRQRLRCNAVSRQSSAAGFCSSCCAAQPAAASQGFPPLVRPNSRAAQRPSRGVALRVVALDRDEDYEQPPEAAGVLPDVARRLEADRSSSSTGSSSKASSRKAAASNPISLTNPIIKAGDSSSSSSSSTAGSSNPISSSSSAPISSSSNGAGPATPAAAAPTATAPAAAAAAAAGAAMQQHQAAAAAASAASSAAELAGASGSAVGPGLAPLYPPAERSQIQESWDALMRWSKTFSKRHANGLSPIEAADKVVVFGGGSFGTAMGSSLALKKPQLDVVLLLRDPYLCKDINSSHCNTKYLPGFTLPRNVRATTDAAEAIAGAQYAVHAVPVQHSRSFLSGVREVLPKDVPIICVSKGLEVGSGCMMSEVIPSALGRRQPAVFLSGPSFAKEVMQGRPTGVVAASKDAALAREVQELFASPCMRVNTSTDVTGVEICGALKNVLAIAAGIVEGLDLGHNALAALIAQGCAEIRWLSQKVGAKPATISGLSGLGDIMLTCYGDLSRNRSVGVRLGRGEKLHDILASSTQVAEGVATAGVVVSLARKYRVSLPVLTAVAQVLDNNLEPAEAVAAVMNLPQIEER